MTNSAFKLLAATVMAISLFMATTTAGSIYGQKKATTSITPMEFLAAQQAQSGSISEINSTAFSLQLNNVSDNTLLFTERPERIVTSVDTSDFIGNWSLGQNSFVVDAPNAIIVVEDNNTQQKMAVIELSKPVYDIDKKTLTYEIIPDNTTSLDLPNEFGQSTLVIDGSGSYVAGFGFAVASILKFKAHKDNPTH